MGSKRVAALLHLLSAGGHDTARVALEAGNSPEVIFMHYRELVTPEEAYAWFNVKPE
jgi:hypothetical protein